MPHVWTCIHPHTWARLPYTLPVLVWHSLSPTLPPACARMPGEHHVAQCCPREDQVDLRAWHVRKAWQETTQSVWRGRRAFSSFRDLGDYLQPRRPHE